METFLRRCHLSRVRLWKILLTTVLLGANKAFSQQREVEITPENENRFPRFVETAASNTAFILASGVELTSTVYIQSANVTIRGNSPDVRLVIRCAEDVDMAFNVSSDGAEFANLEIRNCKGTAVSVSSVVVNPNPFAQQDSTDPVPLNVRFHNIHFVNNKESRGWWSAGAVFIGRRVTAEIDQCLFENNTSPVGGAVFSWGTSLQINNSVFSNNTAVNSGGAIRGSAYSEDVVDPEQERTLSIENTQFLQNRALQGDQDSRPLMISSGADLEANQYLRFPRPTSSGGALSLKGFTSVTITDSEFEGNSAVPAGGAIYLSDNGETLIRNCTFRDNFVSRVAQQRDDTQDLQAGGALFVAFRKTSSQLDIEISRFENNSGVYGGALHVVAPVSARITVTRSNFIDNRAKLGGGAVTFRNVNSPELSGCEFVQNSAFVGGAVFVTNGAGLNVKTESGEPRATFRNNSALDGGAIFGIGTGAVKLEDVEFVGNQASRHGGAICLVDSKAGGEFILQDARVRSNTAEKGGALFLENLERVEIVATSDEAQRNKLIFGEVSDKVNSFFHNAAVAGGAVYYRASNQVRNTLKLTKSRFMNNKVYSSLSVIYPVPLVYPGRAEAVSGELARRIRQDIRNEGLQNKYLLNPSGVEPCYPGGGGAVCLVLTGLSERVPVSVALLDSSFESNSASVGGGLFLSTEEGVDWASECRRANGPCRVSRLRNLTFVGNFALFAGGGLFVSNLNHVYYSSAETEISNEQYQSLVESPYRKELATNNSVGSVGYGPNIASSAVSLRVKNPVPDPETGLLISNHSSGQNSPLPDILIEILDKMNQVVTAGIADSILRVRASAESEKRSIVVGRIEVIAQAGVANFSALAIMAPAGKYEVEFEPPKQSIEKITGSVEIRACLLGEVTKADGSICEKCDVESFSFDTEKSCDACPVHARCRGEASIVPLPNYWHSSPFSTVMLECFNSEACRYENRTSTLEDQHNRYRSEFFERFENGTEDPVFTNEEYTQCAEGYEGPLCGSCADKHRRTDSKICRKCPSKGLTSVVVLGVTLWQLFFVCITLRSALVSIKDMTQMMEFVGNSSILLSAPAVSIADSGTTGAQDLSRLRGILNDPLNAGMTPEQFHEIYDEFREQLATQVDIMPDPATITTARQQNSVDSIIAIQHASETLKIFVNFLQMTSVAININVEWTETVRQMLTTMKPIAGVSRSAYFAPSTCLLNDNMDHRSMYEEILRFLIPLGIILVLMAYYSIRWFIMMRKPHSTRDQYMAFWKSRVIISFLVVMFFSYQSLSEDFMGMVSCVRLDLNEVKNNTLYKEYSIARDWYWTADTNVKCFERKHALLAIILGIPGIVFFLLGVPVFLLFFLLYRRAKGKLLELDMVNTYGFIYQNYQKRFVFWEVCILARKALIGAVIVFAYPWGSNLQGVMASGILILALWMHLTAAPFKYDILNVFEGCSLLVSIFTFYAGLVFNDENTTHAGDDFLSVVLVLINVVLALTLLVAVVYYVDKYAVAKLKILGVQDIPRNFILRSWKLANVVSGQTLLSIRDFIRCRLYRLRVKSNCIRIAGRSRTADAYHASASQVPTQYSDTDQEGNDQDEITVEMTQDRSNE